MELKTDNIIKTFADLKKKGVSILNEPRSSPTDAGAFLPVRTVIVTEFISRN